MTSFRYVLAAACAAFLAFGPSSGNAQDKTDKTAKKGANISKGDMRSMQKMAQADMAEIAAGKVAAEKASNPEVKKYGQHMVDEHSKMLDEGSKLAQAKGMKPPAAPEKKQQDALKKLQGLSGEDFDRQYVQQMVKDHQDALKLAEKTAKDAKDPELKAHAQKGAPHIKEHLAMARKLQEGMSSGAGGTSKSGKGKKSP
jgi:putative membrane protein